MEKLTKCKICKWLKIFGLFLPGIVGYGTIIKLVFEFPRFQDEILKLMEGTQTFLTISSEAREFLIGLLLLPLGIIFFLVGHVLFKRWYCWELKEEL